MRRGIADWSAAALAIAVMAFGGLIVVKPAIDHWDDVYRSDPFVVGTTTQKLRTREPADGKSQASRPRVSRTTTTTTEDASSFAERLLGKSGTLLVRLLLVGLVAYLAGAVLQRALLGDYSLRRTPAAAAPPVVPEPAFNGSGKVRTAKNEPAEAPTATLQNGAETAPESAATLAPGIARLVSSRREALGLSQRELAKRAGISHTVVSRIEGGDHSPSPKTLERLAEVLG